MYLFMCCLKLLYVFMYSVFPFFMYFLISVFRSVMSLFRHLFLYAFVSLVRYLCFVFCCSLFGVSLVCDLFISCLIYFVRPFVLPLVMYLFRYLFRSLFLDFIRLFSFRVS